MPNDPFPLTPWELFERLAAVFIVASIGLAVWGFVG